LDLMFEIGFDVSTLYQQFKISSRKHLKHTKHTLILLGFAELRCKHSCGKGYSEEKLGNYSIMINILFMQCVHG
jgi:hypothetical protein